MPFFSVIIPVYNTESFLEECIQSVISQTYSDWEIILVNDGSTDGSGEIINLYTKNYENIYSYFKDNSGQSESRVYGVKRAKGKYLIFLDSDDVLQNNALETIKYYINLYNNPQCIIYGLRRGDFNSEDWEVWCDDELSLVTDRKEMLKLVLSSPHYNSLCRKAIRKDSFYISEIDYSEMRYGEDLLQTLSVFLRIENLLIIPVVLYSYRQNQSSVTHQIDYLRYIKDSIKFREYSINLLKHYCELNPDEYIQVSRIYLIDFIDIARSVSIKYKSSKRKKLLDLIVKSDVYNSFIRSQKHRYSDIGLKIIVYHLLNAKMYGIIALFERIYQISSHS